MKRAGKAACAIAACHPEGEGLHNSVARIFKDLTFTKEIQEKIRRIESGTTQRVVKLGTIMELQIEVPDKETQRRVVEMDTLCRKKERMYLKLMEQERQLTEIAIRKIMGGTLR